MTSYLLFLLTKSFTKGSTLNPIALRKTKIVCNFGLSECNRVKGNNFPLAEKILSYKTWLSLRRKIIMKVAKLLPLYSYPFTLITFVS